MSYSLSSARPLSESIPAIAASQLDAAIQKLTSAERDHKSIHAARRHFKKVRALLGLVAPLIKGKAAKTGQRRIASTARKFAASRDAQAILYAAAELEQEFGDKVHAKSFLDLKSFLQARRNQAEEKLESIDVKDVVNELEETKTKLTRLDMNGASVAVLIGPAAETYRHGRHAMRVAAASGGDAMHEWRKQVQRHWRHMLLLKEAWPEEAKARVALAKHVSDALGLHHDLDILRDVILANRIVFRTPSDVKMLCAAIETKKKQLESDFFASGERLYAEKPKAFARRLRAYWEIAERHPHANGVRVDL